MPKLAMRCRPLLGLTFACAMVAPVIADPTLVLDIPLTNNGDVNTGNTALQFYRASTAWYPDDSGILREVAADIMGINSNGVWLEPPRENACRNTNSNPVDTAGFESRNGEMSLEVVSAWRLKPAGLQVINNSRRVYNFRNTSTSGQVATVTLPCEATSDVAAASIYARALVRAASLQMSGGRAVPINVGGSFARYRIEKITDAKGQQLQIVVPPKASVQFVLNQLENGEGVTLPIKTDGAPAARAATTLRFAAVDFPDGPFTLYGEFTAASEHQSYDNPMYFDVYANADERYAVNGSIEGVRIHHDAVTVTQGAYAPHQRSAAIAFCTACDDKIRLFVNGVASTLEPEACDPLKISSGTVFVGTRSYGDQYFNGQVKNIRVYAGGGSAASLATLTDIHGADLTAIGGVGLPLFDRNTRGRLWALRRMDSDAFDAIQFSDDWGDRWTVWTTLAQPAVFPVLNRDAQGNFYYANAVGLLRVDGQSKAEAMVAKWYPEDKAWSYFSWAWGEDSSGTLFTAAYTLSGSGGQYIWRSAAGGTAWEKLATLVALYPDDRHIHSLHSNPFDGRLFASWGDSETRGFGSSKDGGISFRAIATPMRSRGPTGITFTSEGTWTSSDIVGDQNEVAAYPRGKNAGFTAWETPRPFQTAPLYYVRSVGRNELWVLAYDESRGQSVPALFKLHKRNQIRSPWSTQKIIGLPFGVAADNSFYALAHDGLSSIPESSPYVFVSTVGRAGEDLTMLPFSGVYRIKRE